MRGIVANVFLELVLTNLGEKMSDEEVDELLKIADTSNGEVNYTGMNCQRFIRERYTKTYQSLYGLSLRINIDFLTSCAYLVWILRLASQSGIEGRKALWAMSFGQEGVIC